eukprot:snap_masked-scaffold_1-processed-gene-14.32-mRNA-1 protein AED:1.00 eAED:1.00 QI:0/-1/0/0/-1/1/1/0/937
MNKQYKDAQAKCVLIIEEFPQVPDPYTVLGDMYEELNKPKLAIQAFTMAAQLEVKGADYSIWMRVGAIAEKIDDLKTAYKAYSTAANRIIYTKDALDDTDEQIDEERKRENGDEEKNFSLTTRNKNIYFNCDFESYEKKVFIAEKVGDFEEATRSVRYILRNQKNPNPKWFSKLLEFCKKQKYTPYRLSKSLEPYIQPLIVVDDEEVRDFLNSGKILTRGEPSEQEKINFYKHLEVFEVFLSALLRLEEPKKVIGYISLFELFLTSPQVDPAAFRFEYLHTAKPKSMPFVLQGLQGGALALLNKEEELSSLVDHIRKAKKSPDYEKAMLYVAECCYLKCFYKVAFCCLEKIEHDGYAFWIRGQIYEQKLEEDKAVEEYKKLLKFMETQRVASTLTRKELDIKFVASKCFEICWKLDRTADVEFLWNNKKFGFTDQSNENFMKSFNQGKLSMKSKTNNKIDDMLPDFGQHTALLDSNCTSRNLVLPDPPAGLLRKPKADCALKLPSPPLNETSSPVADENEKEVESLSSEEESLDAMEIDGASSSTHHFKKGKRRNIFTKVENFEEVPLLRRRGSEVIEPKTPVRPITLKRIELCTALYEAGTYEQCIATGIDLLYPYFGGTNHAVESYKRLASMFPLEGQTPNTYLQEHEVMKIFKLVFLSLHKLEKFGEAVFFTKDLYYSSEVAFVRVTPKSTSHKEIFSFLLFACLAARDLNEISRQLILVLNEIIAHKETNEHFENCQTIFSILTFAFNHSTDKKNFVRIIRRLISSYERKHLEFFNKTPSVPFPLVALLANYDAELENPVRQLQILLAVENENKTNPVLYLLLSSCFLRLRLSRKAADPNKLLLKSFAYLSKYSELIEEKYGEIGHEVEFNMGVFAFHCKLEAFGIERFHKLLKDKDTPKEIIIPAANYLVSLYTDRNPKRAEYIIKHYLTQP